MEFDQLHRVAGERRNAGEVMEYLDGRSLGDTLEKEGRLATAGVVDILEQVCSAVAEAHRLGIVHRDLKPDNIWLEPNRRGGFTVKVLDFGLAKLVAEAPATDSLPRPGPDDMTGVFPAADSGIATQVRDLPGSRPREAEVGPCPRSASMRYLPSRMMPTRVGSPLPMSSKAVSLVITCGGTC